MASLKLPPRVRPHMESPQRILAAASSKHYQTQERSEKGDCGHQGPRGAPEAETLSCLDL